ncbi:YraN family protein [Nocardioides terrisoli]|uniref:YraN family protein n=1 Tax=Nocardioides terrisoli TaxID=3388267 RepID=UPI00287BBED2|nr:YraN family protein [Nocardioides marmorisolisilvae]
MSTAAQNSSLGAYGERVAARLLTEQGMVVIDRNWRCPEGEVDLVLRDGTTLVVCEVKTRSSADYGHPLEAVTPEKANRLRRLALRWLEHHDVRPSGLRIDLVGVLRNGRGAADVQHVRGIG